MKLWKSAVSLLPKYPDMLRSMHPLEYHVSISENGSMSIRGTYFGSFLLLKAFMHMIHP